MPRSCCTTASKPIAEGGPTGRRTGHRLANAYPPIAPQRLAAQFGLCFECDNENSTAVVLRVSFALEPKATNVYDRSGRLLFYELWRSIRWGRCALQELEPSVSVISTSDFMSRFCSNLGAFRAMLPAMKHRSVEHANMHNVGMEQNGSKERSNLQHTPRQRACAGHTQHAAHDTQHAVPCCAMLCHAVPCCFMHGCMRRGLPSGSGRLLCRALQAFRSRCRRRRPRSRKKQSTSASLPERCAVLCCGCALHSWPVATGLRALPQPVLPLYHSVTVAGSA